MAPTSDSSADVIYGRLLKAQLQNKFLCNLCKISTHFLVGEGGGDVLRSRSIFIAKLERSDGRRGKTEERRPLFVAPFILISDAVAVIVVATKEDLDVL